MIRRALAAGLVLVAIAACSGGGESGEPLTGRALAEDVGCLSCHTDTATAVAPTWNGLWGSEVELEDGTTVIADEGYVLRSIEDPQADIVAGYGSAMPTMDLTEEEKSALVDYIESLG